MRTTHASACQFRKILRAVAPLAEGPRILVLQKELRRALERAGHLERQGRAIERELRQVRRELARRKAGARHQRCEMQLELLAMEARCWALEELCRALVSTIEQAACTELAEPPRISHDGILEKSWQAAREEASTAQSSQVHEPSPHCTRNARVHGLLIALLTAGRPCAPIAPCLPRRALSVVAVLPRAPSRFAPAPLCRAFETASRPPFQGHALLPSQFPRRRGHPLRECRASLSRSSGEPAASETRSGVFEEPLPNPKDRIMNDKKMVQIVGAVERTVKGDKKTWWIRLASPSRTKTAATPCDSTTCQPVRLAETTIQLRDFDPKDAAQTA